MANDVRTRVLLEEVVYLVASHAGEPESRDAQSAILCLFSDLRSMLSRFDQGALSRSFGDALSCYGIPAAALDLLDVADPIGVAE